MTPAGYRWLPSGRHAMSEEAARKYAGTLMNLPCVEAVGLGVFEAQGPLQGGPLVWGVMIIDSRMKSRSNPGKRTFRDVESVEVYLNYWQSWGVTA